MEKQEVPTLSDFDLLRSQSKTALNSKTRTWPVLELIKPEYSAAILASQPEQDFSAACQHVVSKNDRLADQSLKNLKGHFVVVIWNETTTFIVTDCGGSVGIYYGYSGAGLLAVSTNVNSVGSSLSAAFDEVSVRDFVYNQMICHPYTWFEEVRAADPATITELGQTGSVSKRAYWLPNEQYLCTDDAVTLVRASFGEAVASCLKEAKEVSILYSGGDDSRAVASHIPRGTARKGFVFLEERNRELLLAKLSSRALGFNVTRLRQGTRHYLEDIGAKIKLLGAGISLDHSHIYGHHKRIPVGVVLGGWTADTFLKCHYVDAGLRKFAAVSHLSADRYGGAIHERYLERRTVLETHLPSAASEWQWFWPISQHEHYANFASSRRLTQMHEPFMSSEMVQVWSRISPADKRSSEVYRRGIAGRMGIARFIPRSGGQIIGLHPRLKPLARPFVSALFWFADRVLFRSASHHGPWKRSQLSKSERAIARREKVRLSIATGVSMSRLVQAHKARKILTYSDTAARN